MVSRIQYDVCFSQLSHRTRAAICVDVIGSINLHSGVARHYRDTYTVHSDKPQHSNQLVTFKVDFSIPLVRLLASDGDCVVVEPITSRLDCEN